MTYDDLKIEEVLTDEEYESMIAEALTMDTSVYHDEFDNTPQQLFEQSLLRLDDDAWEDLEDDADDDTEDEDDDLEDDI